VTPTVEWTRTFQVPIGAGLVLEALESGESLGGRFAGYSQYETEEQLGLPFGRSNRMAQFPSSNPGRKRAGITSDVRSEAG
jgi:hypothetical protein